MRINGFGPAGTTIQLRFFMHNESERKAVELVHQERCISDANGRFVLHLPPVTGSLTTYSLVLETLTAQPNVAADLAYVRRPGTASPKRQKIRIDDILFGEVWVTGGGINMEIPLEAADEGKYANVLKDYQQVRFLPRNRSVWIRNARISFRPQAEVHRAG